MYMGRWRRWQGEQHVLFSGGNSQSGCPLAQFIHVICWRTGCLWAALLLLLLGRPIVLLQGVDEWKSERDRNISPSLFFHCRHFDIFNKFALDC